MNHSEWIDPIAAIIDGRHGRGGFLVVFPEYRPDLFVALAGQLGLQSFDYRAKVMSDHGWDADRLSLQDLDSTLADLAAKGGTLVTNVEALLSTKNPHECADWISSFLDTDQEHTLLIPIVINASQVPDKHPRVHWIPGDALAEQSFLNRLVY